MDFLNVTDPYLRYVKRKEGDNACDARNAPGATTLEASFGGKMLDAIQDYANGVALGLKPNAEPVLVLADSKGLRGFASKALHYIDSNNLNG